jgi:hypothetical protein
MMQASAITRLATAALAIVQFAIAHTSWIGLVRIVSLFGATAVAGYTIALRINIGSHFPVTRLIRPIMMPARR